MIKYLSIILPSLIFAGNLSEIVQSAIEKNENLKASKIKIDKSKLEREAIIDSYMPSIDIGSNFAISSKDTLTSPKSVSNSYAKLSLIAYDGGKREAILKAQQNLIDMARYSYIDNENLISLETIRAYYQKSTVVANIDAKEQEIEQLKAELSRLEKFYIVGTTSKDEVEKIRANLSLSLSNLAELKLMRDEIDLNLEWLTNQKIDIKFGSTLLDPKGNPIEPRADIKAQKSSLEALKEQNRAKKSPLYPSLSLENSYNLYEYNTNLDKSNLIDRENRLTLNLNWKVFDFGATKESYQASMLEYEADKENLNSKERKAKLELENAKNSLEIAKTKIDANLQRVKSSKETYEAIKKKFQVGIVDNVAYLDALRDKFEAIASLESAKNDYEVKKATYYYYAGLNIKEFIK